MSIFETAPEPKFPLARHRVLSSTAGVRVSPICFGRDELSSAWSGFQTHHNFHKLTSLSFRKDFMGKAMILAIFLILSSSKAGISLILRTSINWRNPRRLSETEWRSVV
jgi:hypothetical protein